MDWARIEKEVSESTDSFIRRRNSLSSRSDLRSNALPRGESIYDSPDQSSNPNNRYIGSHVNVAHDVPIDVSHDILELKNQIMQQNQKLTLIERTMRGFGDLIETSNGGQLDCIERLNQMEIDVHNISKYVSNSSRDRSEVLVQSKTINLRFQQLEESLRRIDESFVTKDAFTQLLDTCVDQLQNLGGMVESAKTSGAQFSSFADSFLSALWEIRGSATPGFRIDFLASLTA